MTKILIATHNEKKRRELKTLLKDFKDIKIMNFDDLRVPPPIIIENGKTFRQNAIKKAVTVSRFFDGIVLADDSGLEVDALGGRPGVRSARFARAKATDQENNKKLVKLLTNISEKKRSARFVCHIAVASNGILLDSFEGAIKGKIIPKGRGKSGFGYDPLFVPNGREKTFAEMSAVLKNRISHRALALKHLKKDIKKYLN